MHRNVITSFPSLLKPGGQFATAAVAVAAAMLLAPGGAKAARTSARARGWHLLAVLPSWDSRPLDR